MKKKILIALALILLLLLGAFFFVVPAQLEKRLNVDNGPQCFQAVDTESSVTDIVHRYCSKTTFNDALAIQFDR
jgi:hypothetical protein